MPEPKVRMGFVVLHTSFPAAGFTLGFLSLIHVSLFQFLQIGKYRSGKEKERPREEGRKKDGERRRKRRDFKEGEVELEVCKEGFR